MGGYSLNVEYIQEELDNLRIYIFENRLNLTWKQEGDLLQQIDVLKRDLQYARNKTSPCL